MKIHQTADASMCRDWFQLRYLKFSEDCTLSTWLHGNDLIVPFAVVNFCNNLNVSWYTQLSRMQ